MAYHDLLMMACHYTHEWSHLPPGKFPFQSDGVTPVGWWRNSSLWARRMKTENSPHQGSGAGRDLAHVLDLVAWSLHLAVRGGFQLLGETERDLFAWRDDCRRWLVRAMPADCLLQRREHGRSNFSPEPPLEPGQWEAQMLELALLGPAYVALFGQQGIEWCRQGWKTIQGLLNDPDRYPRKWVARTGVDGPAFADPDWPGAEPQVHAWSWEATKDVPFWWTTRDPKTYVAECLGSEDLMYHAGDAVGAIQRIQRWEQEEREEQG
jgi:hypothetical protein